MYTIDLTDKSYTPQQKAAVLATMAQVSAREVGNAGS